jgi:hypothetical protein
MGYGSDVYSGQKYVVHYGRSRPYYAPTKVIAKKIKFEFDTGAKLMGDRRRARIKQVPAYKYRLKR